ncbi:MAG: sortase [Bacilli bacterium]|nr:sortase [Bacilli bacterium]
MLLGLTKLCAVISSLSLNIAFADYNNNPVLSIPKINLNQEFYPNDKLKNNVDRGIQVIDGSTMPDKNGNLILAAHSGSSSIAYFKHLDLVNIGDRVFVDYKGHKYSYVISNIYDVEKTGFVKIKRNNKQTLTLITCKKNTNKQTVFIGYLTPN